MSVILTDSDYDELKRELGLSVPRIKQSLASEDNMGQLSVAQLKTIIRFLKVRFRVHIAVSGRKDQLIDNIAGTIYSSGICIPHPTVHSVPTTTHEINTFNYNDASFVEHQSPFFEQLKQLLVFLFPKHETTYQKRVFSIDPATFDAVRSSKGFVQVRFFNKEKGVDIPWNIDVKLVINGQEIDLSKFARKIRSKPFKDPFILPRPVDISACVQLSNSLEFIHPGECGVVIIQFVRERSVDQLIEATKRTSPLNSLIKSNHEDCDVEEVNYMLSLRCPLSCARISTPAKSRNCSHAQCFDMKTYLEYSHQQQLWQCPICNKKCPYQDLIVDPKFTEILSLVSSEDLQVVVHPDGSFEVPDISKQRVNSSLSGNNSTPDNNNTNNHNTSNFKTEPLPSSSGADPLLPFSNLNIIEPPPLPPNTSAPLPISNNNMLNMSIPPPINNVSNYSCIVISDDES